VVQAGDRVPEAGEEAFRSPLLGVRQGDGRPQSGEEEPEVGGDSPLHPLAPVSRTSVRWMVQKAPSVPTA